MITRYSIRALFTNATTEVQSVKDVKGEWCIASEALTVATRLEQQLAEERDQHLRTIGELATAKAEIARLREENGTLITALAHERIEHEATKAKLDITRAHFEGLLDTVDECARNLERAQAAEARVQELTISRDQARGCVSSALDRVAELEARLEMSIDRCSTVLARALIAEARVAELERDIEDHLTELAQRAELIDRLMPLEHAIDQARGLLNQAKRESIPDWLCRHIVTWLRAHPAPAKGAR